MMLLALAEAGEFGLLKGLVTRGSHNPSDMEELMHWLVAHRLYNIVFELENVFFASYRDGWLRAISNDENLVRRYKLSIGDYFVVGYTTNKESIRALCLQRAFNH
jgi:hypothetical protein